MKKWYCVILCMLLGLLVAFAQTVDAVSVQDDTGNTADESETPVVIEKDDAAPMPVSEEPSGEASTVTDPDDTLGETTDSTDVDVPESVNSPAASINEVDEASDTKTVISTGKDGGTQEKKDALQALEMNEPTYRTKHRPLSMHSGLTLAAIGANNALSFQDFFKPELVIDFNKLSKKTIKSGIHAGVLFNFDWFFQFTVLGEHTVKLSTTVNADGWTNVSKSLVDLIAKGNTANAKGETIKGTLNAKLNAFADTGIMYQLKKPDYSFAARFAYFLPIAYMENPQATFTLSPKKNGDDIEGLIMEAEGTANIYGHLPAMAAGRGLSVANFFKDWGLDLSLAGSYSPTNWVTVTGGVSYLPLKSIKMNTGIRNYFKFKGTVDNILGSLQGQNKDIFTQNTETDKFASDLPQKKIMRPCKIQIGADFRPFQNNYLILSPSFAFPVINAKPYYVDGGLKIESRFAKVLGVYLDTGCIERMWRHELCFFIASRGFTLNLAASVASQDFRRTFTTLSGIGLKFGAGIGF